ncbi:unnamed protein product, partial [Discosporangium mesarthrocarpum]
MALEAGGLGRSHWQGVPGAWDPGVVSRVRALEEERAALVVNCRRLQGKADAAIREAGTADMARESLQRRLRSTLERATAAERQGKEAASKVRQLESDQAMLEVEKTAAVQRCETKHKQLLSALDMQMTLRAQLEALLDQPPPHLREIPFARAGESPSKAVSLNLTSTYPSGSVPQPRTGGRDGP